MFGIAFNLSACSPDNEAPLTAGKPTEQSKNPEDNQNPNQSENMNIKIMMEKRTYLHL